MQQSGNYMPIGTTSPPMNPPPSEQEKWNDEYNRIWSKMGQSWNDVSLFAQVNIE